MRTDPQHDALHRLELITSHLLRVGVLIAGVFLLIGWVWLWIKNGDSLQNFQTYEPTGLIESIHWSLVNNDRAMMVSIVGMVLLVLLPVARVFMTGVLFIKQKDYILALMAFLVFIALVASCFLGIDL